MQEGDMNLVKLSSALWQGKLGNAKSLGFMKG